MVEFVKNGRDDRYWTAEIEKYLVTISCNNNEDTYEILLDDMLNFYGPLTYKGYLNYQLAISAAPRLIKAAVKERQKEIKRYK